MVKDQEEMDFWEYDLKFYGSLEHPYDEEFFFFLYLQGGAGLHFFLEFRPFPLKFFSFIDIESNILPRGFIR